MAGLPVNRFEGVTPIFRVRNLKASIDHYTKVLGFKVNWIAQGIMASVSRDGVGIMLCERDQGQPGTWVWFAVGDVDALHQEYVATGATVRLAPTNYQWAREMHVEDPDGHVLRFGSEPRTDRPFSDWVPWYRTGSTRGAAGKAGGPDAI